MRDPVVLQLSDVHFTASGAPVEGRDADERLQSILGALAQRAVRVDAIVVTGDLTEDGSQESCTRLKDAVLKVGVPVLAVPGNHDRTEVVQALFPRPSLEVGRWRILGVNTARPGQAHGTVDTAAELARLDGHDSRPTLIAMHHPPTSPSTHPWFQLGGGDDFAHALVDRPHVKAIVSGHLHEAFTLPTPSGLPVHGCPSTLIAWRQEGAAFQVGSGATGARLLTLSADGTVKTDLLFA